MPSVCRCTRGGVVIVGAMLVATSAVAGTFDERGRLDISDAAFQISFDEPSAVLDDLRMALYDTATEEISRQQILQQFVEDEAGLEGTGAMLFGGRAMYATLELDGLPDLDGRRVEMRLWQRPEGTRAAFDMYWYVEQGYAGGLTLLPTGRVTDDGWEEWSTGPFDFAAGGAAGPSMLTITDSQVLAYYAGQFAGYDEEVQTRLDALEILDLGPASVAPVACNVVDEAAQCGHDGLCRYGRCVDAALVAGPVPGDGSRADYLERRIFEFRTFEAGRLPRQRVAHMEAALAPLRAHATAASFWPTLHVAVEELRDGHASAPIVAYPVAANAGICLHLGRADLLPENGIRPLVFSATGINPVASQLQPGDVLVEIDGQLPELWQQSARRLLRYPGDPAGFEVNVAEQLMGAAVASGATLTFARCEVASGCTEQEVQYFDIELGAMLENEFWAGATPEWLGESVTCDFRFRRALNVPGVRDYEFAGWADEDGVRTVLFNGFPSYYSEGGEAWFTTVAEALDPAPDLLIVDERYGGGGSIEATDFMAAMLLPENDYLAMELWPALDREVDSELRATMASCQAEADPWDYTDNCGWYSEWVPGEASDPGARGRAGNTKVAVLIGLDVSGNDFFTRMISYRSTDLAVMGAGATWGAFGPIIRLPTHLGELSGGSLQINDTLFRASPDDDNTDFATGVGVQPDQVVWQRQSDCLLGVDTAIEHARRWLLEDSE